MSKNGDNLTIGLSGRGTARTSGRATLSTMREMAANHLLGAAVFARQAGIIERDRKDEPSAHWEDEVLYRVTASVMMSVASLEAYIKHRFTEAEKHFSEEKHNEWQIKATKRRPTSNLRAKFIEFIRLKDLSPLDFSTPPFGDADILAKLRNALTHYNPEWSHVVISNDHDLSEMLRKKFKPAWWLPRTQAIFPYGWACHACAVWAVKTAEDSIDRFDDLIGVPRKLEPFSDRLNTDAA